LHTNHEKVIKNRFSSPSNYRSSDYLHNKLADAPLAINHTKSP
jgi:hypothetical protein